MILQLFPEKELNTVEDRLKKGSHHYTQSYLQRS
jgi:hypothetical protein